MVARTKRNEHGGLWLVELIDWRTRRVWQWPRRFNRLRLSLRKDKTLTIKTLLGGPRSTFKLLSYVHATGRLSQYTDYVSPDRAIVLPRRTCLSDEYSEIDGFTFENTKKKILISKPFIFMVFPSSTSASMLSKFQFRFLAFVFLVLVFILLRNIFGFDLPIVWAVSSLYFIFLKWFSSYFTFNFLSVTYLSGQLGRAP